MEQNPSSPQTQKPTPPSKIPWTSLIAIIIASFALLMSSMHYAHFEQEVSFPPNQQHPSNPQIIVQIDYTGMASDYLQVDSIIPSPIIYFGGSTLTVNITITSTALENTHSIDVIKTSSSDLSIVSVSPTLPYSLSPGQTVTLTVVVKTTSGNSITGPVVIDVYTS